MITDIATVVSLLIAVTAVCLTLWQNVLQRRAAEAQVFLNMLDKFGSVDVYNGFMSLRELELDRYSSLEEFEKEVSTETQFQIYKFVEFLNDTARLVWSGYLPRQRVWDIYFMVYRTANRKLLPWWLESQRQRTYGQQFIAFEEMCLQVADITPEEIKRHDEKDYPRYSRKHHDSLGKN